MQSRFDAPSNGSFVTLATRPVLSALALMLAIGAARPGTVSASDDGSVDGFVASGASPELMVPNWSFGGGSLNSDLQGLTVSEASLDSADVIDGVVPDDRDATGPIDAPSPINELSMEPLVDLPSETETPATAEGTTTSAGDPGQPAPEDITGAAVTESIDTPTDESGDAATASNVVGDPPAETAEGPEPGDTSESAADDVTADDVIMDPPAETVAGLELGNTSESAADDVTTVDVTADDVIMDPPAETVAGLELGNTGESASDWVTDDSETLWTGWICSCVTLMSMPQIELTVLEVETAEPMFLRSGTEKPTELQVLRTLTPTANQPSNQTPVPGTLLLIPAGLVGLSRWRRRS